MNENIKRPRFFIDDATNDEILTRVLLGGETRASAAKKTGTSTAHASNLVNVFLYAKDGTPEKIVKLVESGGAKGGVSSRTIEYCYRRLGQPVPDVVTKALAGKGKKKEEPAKEEEPVKEEIEQSDLHENDGAFYVNVLVKLERIANDLERLIRLWT